MNRLLKDIKDIESTYIYYDKEHEEYFEFRKGDIPIILSAPHGARHLRNGNWKEEDEYTSSIAIKLSEITGAYVIFVKNATKEDPNYIEDCRYKEAITDVIKKHQIKFLVDIHGANNDRNFKICVGIIDNNREKCSCPSFKDIIERACLEFQEKIFNLDGLTASSPGTVTSFAKSTLGIEAAQFEINGKYRIISRMPNSAKAKMGKEPDYKADEQNVMELIGVMESIIININKVIAAKKI